MAKKRKARSDESWDLDSYKTDYESEEHWALRRRFMEVHKDKFPEDQLVCLAQVFTNIEFMGCKYPSETMRLVGELSQDVAKEFRAKRANRLKRTFVKASDAAEARAKGRKTQQKPEQECSKFKSKKRRGFGSDDRMNNNLSQPVMRCNFFDELPYGKLVLHLVGHQNCLSISAQRAKMEYKERESSNAEGKKAIEIVINGNSIASACGDNIKMARSAAFTKSLEILQKTCYSIKFNPSRETIKIDKSGNEVTCGVSKDKIENVEDKRLDSNNKGFKIMQMMGWTGGGLGSMTQGREEPVGYLLKNNRCGLGSECNLDREYFTQILKNYIESEDIRELHFEHTFTKDERVILHELAGQFRLKSNSHGKGDKRSLVISKKNMPDEHILTEVLIRKNPKYCDSYLVQVPLMRSKDFPDHTKHLALTS